MGLILAAISSIWILKTLNSICRLLKSVAVAFKHSRVLCLRLMAEVRMVLMLKQALFGPTSVNIFFVSLEVSKVKGFWRRKNTPAAYFLNAPDFIRRSWKSIRFGQEKEKTN